MKVIKGCFLKLSLIKRLEKTVLVGYCWEPDIMNRKKFLTPSATILRQFPSKPYVLLAHINLCPVCGVFCSSLQFHM